MENENMKKVCLESLDLEFPTFSRFRDDGVVKGLARHYQKVQEEFDPPLESDDLKKNIHVLNNATGICYSFRKEDDTKYTQDYHVIFYLQLGNYYDFMTKAHEETHALERMGRINLLKQKIEGEVGPINLAGKDSEFIANVGGFYFLDKQGYDISKLDLFKDPFFESALAEFLSAKRN